MFPAMRLASLLQRVVQGLAGGKKGKKLRRNGQCFLIDAKEYNANNL